MILETSQVKAQTNMSNIHVVKIEANATMFELLSSRLYSDKPMAVLRELSTNAVDAQIANGCTKPFSVHLPTRLDPVLKIRDYGIGMDNDTVIDLYGTMGASSKRNSNAYNGALGVGSKSPFSYTAGSAFTVTSFYDNKKTIYSVFADEGIPAIAELGSMDTEEPNGLEVSVPIKVNDIGNFTSSATKLYRHFNHKPEVNIELDLELGNILYEGTNWKIYGNSNKPVVVMANVAYPIDFNHSQISLLRVLNTQGLVIEIPTGSIQFAASRESLSYTESTINKLKEFDELIKKEILKEVDKIVVKHKDNLLLLSKSLRGMPAVTRQLYASNHTIKYLDNYSDFSIRGREFKFKYLNTYNSKYTNTCSVSYSVLSKYELIMADNLRMAEAIAQHMKTTGRYGLIVTFTDGVNSYSSKEEAFNQIKQFMDILGKPYVIASEEALKIFGKNVRATKGAVSTNLSYRATGFKYDHTRPNSCYVTNNNHLVNKDNKAVTIGVPVSSRVLCDIKYENIIGYGSLGDITYILRFLKYDKSLTFVTIPKTHKEHLQNTTDIFTFLSSILPKSLSGTTNKLYNEFLNRVYGSTINDSRLPKDFLDYNKEVDTLLNDYDYNSVESIIKIISRFGFEVKLEENKLSAEAKVARKKYKSLDICSFNVDNDSFIELAKLIDSSELCNKILNKAKE